MRRSALLLSTCLLIAALPSAQTTSSSEPIDTEVNSRLQVEEDANSKVMWIAHNLTDVLGPRLTGSPGHENAAKWAVATMQTWGMTNGALEPWNWNHEGWTNDEAYGAIVEPIKDNLVFEVEAWTPSTKGVVTAPAVKLVTPTGPPLAATGRGAAMFQGPTSEELEAYLASMAAKVKDAVVFVGNARVPAFVEVEGSKRQSDESLRARYGTPAAGEPSRRGDGAGGRGATPSETGRLSPSQVNQRVHAFLLANGAAMRIVDAYRRHGQITAYNAGRTEGVAQADRYDSTKTLPTVVLRNEDYGRIARLLDDGTAVTLKFNIVNRTFPAGRTSYNAVAEIRGTDKADEVVMLGGHLDSWHAATGATDNAVGCAIMMEAVRVLQTIGARPRRTIRVALWSGEEEGLLGSLAYVEQHFGTAEQPKPEFSKLSAYWNIDNGTGRVRGASVFGPPEVAQVLAQLFKPFETRGVVGAAATSSRATGGTDSTSFNHAGLPGIGAQQDPIEYSTHTHHTNLDTYERLVPDDVKQAAVVTASLMYHLASREQMLPRFAADQMPALAGRGQ